MTRITVLGGTGYAGSHIVAEAASRGHEVTSVSRAVSVTAVPAVTYVSADLTDPQALADAVAGAQVVVEALSPRGALTGKLAAVVRELAVHAHREGARLGVVGGAGSLLVTDDGPTVAQSDGFPDQFKPEAAELAEILSDLRRSDASLDWFYLSPAGGFGSWAPGTHTGAFRLGGEVLLTDAAGNSDISGADYAQAFVDEIDSPAHHRQRFTVAY